MATSQDPWAWRRQFCRGQWKEQEGEVDRRKDGKINIKEWTGMGFGDSLRAAEDREGWKGIVAMSSLVPRRPQRLRDCDEMSAHSFASNWQLPFSGRERMASEIFHDHPHERMLLEVRIEPATVRIPGGHESDQATAPSFTRMLFAFGCITLRYNNIAQILGYI